MKARFAAIWAAGTQPSVATGPAASVGGTGPAVARGLVAAADECPRRRGRVWSVAPREVEPAGDVVPGVHPVRAAGPRVAPPHLHVDVGTRRAARHPDVAEHGLLAVDDLAPIADLLAHVVVGRVEAAAVG